MRDNANIVINLGEGAERSGWGGALDNSGFPITYKVYLIGITKPSIYEIPVTGTTAKTTVTIGDYKVEVNAYVNGWDYSYCLTEQFTVTAGQTKQVQVNMQRLPNAVVLSVPKGEVLDFGSAAIGGTAPAVKDVKVYNFTDKQTLTITTGSSPASGLSWASVSANIPQDDYLTFSIMPNTTATGVHDTALTLSWSGGSTALGLKYIVCTALIINEAGLTAITSDLSGYYVLGNDINLTGVAWTPIGTTAAPFTGTFDGNGHTINGLTVTNTTIKYPSLFGRINGATVKNLGLTNVNINNTDTNNGNGVGGIAGMINNSVIQKCYVTGNITGYWYVGGITGYNNGGTIENCYSTANVTATTTNAGATATTAGGIYGGNSSGLYTVKNCYATGIISSGSGGTAGGLGGHSDADATLTGNVALNATVTGNTRSGRVTGVGTTNTADKLSNNKARKDMQLNGSTASGTATDQNGVDVPLGTPLPSVFSGWDTSVWTIPSGNLTVNGSLPTLKGFTGGQNPTLP